VRFAYDQPEWVARNLQNFMESLLEGILLLMAVVTLGLGLRSAAVVAVAIPLSIGGALVGLFSFGFALEQVSKTRVMAPEDWKMGRVADGTAEVIGAASKCTITPRPSALLPFLYDPTEGEARQTLDTPP
jgi:hypothetical protein